MEALQALEQWLTENGGYIHPSVHLYHDNEHGSCFLATSALKSGTPIISVPHSLSLSRLNAQVDDAFPAFKKHANSFLVESLGFFYLMAQWVNREKSFWKVYLETLPTPEQGFGTPFWFGEEDLVWLEGTDVHASFFARQGIWRAYWMEGVAVLEGTGMAVDAYTWDLFKWAATVYTSRSFNSRTVRPQDGKSWTAYKQVLKDRQSVFLDLSLESEERRDFPVLFPIMDAGNHDPNAKVGWSYDPSRFELAVQQPILLNTQIFNNYGPKSNDELLMGYGFCVAGNPHDCVRLAMKPPPILVQQLLQSTHPGYFHKSGSWHSEAATFNIASYGAESFSTNTTPFSLAWTRIPVPLAELFFHIVRTERGLALTPQPAIEQYLFHNGAGAKYLPRIAFYITMSLAPKIAKIDQHTALLPPHPQNAKQANAQIYRNGQLATMRETQARMAAYLRSLRPGAVVGHRAAAIWTLEEVLDVCVAEKPDSYGSFTAGLKYCVGTTKLRKIRGSEAEEQVWALWLCFALLSSRGLSPGGSGGGALSAWIEELRAEYGDVVEDEEDGDAEDDNDASVAGILDAVHTAGMVLPGSAWSSSGWTSGLVLDWGIRIARSQGMHMRIAEGDVRYVLYLHLQDVVQV